MAILIGDISKETSWLGAMGMLRFSSIDLSRKLEEIYNLMESENYPGAASIAQKNFQMKRASDIYNKLSFERRRVGGKLIYRKLTEFDNMKSIVDYFTTPDLNCCPRKRLLN